MVARLFSQFCQCFCVLCFYNWQCYNKIDQISLEEVDKLARQPHSVVTSCEMGLNLDYLLQRVWEDLALLRVFTKKRGRELGGGGGGSSTNTALTNNIKNDLL